MSTQGVTEANLAKKIDCAQGGIRRWLNSKQSAKLQEKYDQMLWQVLSDFDVYVAKSKVLAKAEQAAVGATPAETTPAEGVGAPEAKAAAAAAKQGELQTVAPGPSEPAVVGLLPATCCVCGEVGTRIRKLVKCRCVYIFSQLAMCNLQHVHAIISIYAQPSLHTHNHQYHGTTTIMHTQPSLSMHSNQYLWTITSIYAQPSDHHYVCTTISV